MHAIYRDKKKASKKLAFLVLNELVVY